VEDTLPGLSNAGEANAYIADSSRTLLFVTSVDEEQRAKVRQEIDQLSQRTTSFLDKYRQSVFEPEDRTNFLALVDARQHYIQVRNQILDLASAGKQKEALAEYNEALLPAHLAVKKAGDKVMQYNREQGKQRGLKIMRICTATQVYVAITSVIIFILGFLIGLFK
jgi:hypothetical protein